MAVNKNFVVKHGLEVKTDLLVADANVSRVGIGTTLARHKLHVNGDVKIESNLQVVGVTSLGTNTRILTGTLEAGNTGVGTYGQFLVATGAGIAWTTAPNLRKQEIFTGTEGQKQFNFAHTIGFLDIFVNGVKLSTSEYTETAAFVTLLNGTSDGDTVELIGYYLFDNIGAANTTGIQGITVLEENAITGSPANVTSINFIGAHVTAAGTGAGVTVSFLGAGVGIGSSGTQIGYGFTNINFIGAGNTFKINGQSIDVSINSGSENYWVQNASGIHTAGRVGIGSTLPNSGVGLDVRDIIKTDSFFASPKVIDKDIDTIADYNNFAVGPVSIENGRSIVVVPDSTLTFFGDSSGIYISAGDWRRTSVGIHTFSKVGIGTTNPRFDLEVGTVGYASTSLWVNGNARVTGILTVGTSSIILDGNTDTVTAGIVTAGKVYGVHNIAFATGDYGTLTATTTDDFGVSILSQFDLLKEPSGEIDSFDFGIIGEVVYDSISWAKSYAGIHTLSNVGIGTTLPRFELEVGAVGYADTSLWVNGNARIVDTVTAGIVTAGKVFGVHALTFATGDYGALTATNIDDFGVSLTSQFDMLREPTGKIDTVDFGTIGDVVYDTTLWLKSSVGIHTLSNVGIGTTNPTSALTVTGNGNFTGVVTATTFVGDGSGLTGIVGSGSGVIIKDSGSLVGTAGTIDFGDNLSVSAISAGVVTVTGSAGGGSSQFVTTSAGIHTLSNVGIGTTNPTSALTVTGDALINGLTVGLGSGAITTNTALGVRALFSNTAGSYNTATGFNALCSNIGGVNNTATGVSALRSNTTGTNNIAIGVNALCNNTTGSHNTGIGIQSLLGSTTGCYNTANGFNALCATTTGNFNTATGYHALKSNTTSNYNTANGVNALCVTTGSNNTGIGISAGNLISSGSKNTILGSYTGNQNGLDIRTSSNNVVLSDGDGNIRFYANSSGNVGIGTTNPTSKLHVLGDVNITGIITVTDSRLQSVSEKSTIVSGNTVSLVYNAGGGNVAICTNPTGAITLNVTGIPTDSSFDNRTINFTVVAIQTSTGYACTTINLNGVSRTTVNGFLKYPGGVVSVASTNSYDIFNFTGINTVGSGSTTENYQILGMVNGNFK